MGKAFEVVDFFRTVGGADAAPGATTPYSDVSATIRNFPLTSTAQLCALWTAGATAGIARIRSPRLHDMVQGIRYRYPAAAAPRDRLTEYEYQALIAQDNLTIEMQVGAAETDGISGVIYYDDLTGIDANLHTPEEIGPRIVDIYTDEVAIASGVAVGNRGVSVAMNAGFDLMKANTDYALLGYEVDVTGQSIGIRGSDTGNIRVGGPMTVEPMETRDWFVRLSKKLGKACIPVINSANKASTFVDNVQVVAGVACNVTLVMAQLGA